MVCDCTLEYMYIHVYMYVSYIYRTEYHPYVQSGTGSDAPLAVLHQKWTTLN